MFKRMFVVCLASLSGLVCGTVTNCFADTQDNLSQAKQSIVSLIEAGRFAESMTATDKLAADFAGDTNLSQTLYSLIQKYELANRIEEAKRVYQQIAKSNPDDSYAKSGVSREEVISLIYSRDYAGAQKALDKMTVELAGNPFLPESLYWIAEEYKWARKFKDANAAYQQILHNFPDSPWAQKAKLGVSKVGVWSLIMSQDYEKAGQALDKLVIDFAGNPDLPETLYWIAGEFKWAKQFEGAKTVYEQIINKYPDSPWADKAKLGVSRVEAFSLIESQDYKGAKQAIDKMAVDFAGHPDLAETLYWLAERYKWSLNFAQAKLTHQQIIQQFPDSAWAEKAKSGISGVELLSAVMSRNFDRPEETIGNLSADFTGNPDLSQAIISAGDQYYRQGLAKKRGGLADEAKECFEKAIKIWEGFINKPPDSKLVTEAYSLLGDSCNELGRYDEALAYYKKACDAPGLSDSPSEDGIRWHSLFMTGQCYQKLRESGNIPDSQADPLIIAAYERLVQDSYASPLARDAWRQLGFLYAKNNQWSETARCFEAYLRIIPEVRCPPEIFYNLARAYDEMGRRDSAKRTYTMFIKSVMPNDPRRKEAKERLAKLSEAD